MGIFIFRIPWKPANENMEDWQMEESFLFAEKLVDRKSQFP